MPQEIIPPNVWSAVLLEDINALATSIKIETDLAEKLGLGSGDTCSLQLMTLSGGSITAIEIVKATGPHASGVITIERAAEDGTLYPARSWTATTTLVRAAVTKRSMAALLAQISAGAGGSVGVWPMGLRLTLQTGVPVAVANLTAKTTLYATPFASNKFMSKYGGAWAVYGAVGDLSVPNTGLAPSTNFDAFVEWTGSAGALTLTAWTNDSTRAVALVRDDGVLVKSGDAAKTYIGTVRTDADGKFEDSESRRFVWNAFCQMPRNLLRQFGTGDTVWTSSSASFSSANGDDTLRCEWVQGLAQAIDATGFLLMAIDADSARIGASGLGLDSTTVNSAQFFGGQTGGYQVRPFFPVWSELCQQVAAGYHYLQLLQRASGEVIYFAGTLSAGGSIAWRGGVKGLVLA